MKIKWKVADRPIGFSQRGWPSGYRADGAPIAHIVCEDEYIPARVRANRHKPLRVRMAIKNQGNDAHKFGTWRWRTLKGVFPTLAAAKVAAENFYNAHSELFM